MAKCPNCEYLLVLLEKRRKYKCAKCGKLFPQKEIETKEFVEQNKIERIKARKQLKKEADQNYQARKRIPTLIEELKNPKPKKTTADYYEENRDALIEKSRQWRKGLSGQEKKEQNEKRKARRYENIDDTRLQGRINYWKMQQKALALQFYENELNTAYS